MKHFIALTEYKKLYGDEGLLFLSDLIDIFKEKQVMPTKTELLSLQILHRLENETVYKVRIYTKYLEFINVFIFTKEELMDYLASYILSGELTHSEGQLNAF